MATFWRFSEYPDFRSTFRHPTALANAAGAELEAEVPADWLHLVAKPMRTSRGSNDPRLCPKTRDAIEVSPSKIASYFTIHGGLSMVDTIPHGWWMISSQWSRN